MTEGPESFVAAARTAALAADTATAAREAMRSVLSGAYQRHLITIVQYSNALHDIGKEIAERFRSQWGCPL